MPITDYGTVGSQIGGGTIGQNSMRNFSDEMNMASNGLQNVAKRKANQFQNEAMKEMAKYGAAPSGGGNNIGSIANGASSLLKALGGLGGGGSSIGGGGSSWSMGSSGFDLSGDIFSAGALDSIPDFGSSIDMGMDAGFDFSSGLGF